MAVEGLVTTNQIKDVCLELSWKLTSQDQEANTSTISWTLHGAGTGKAIYGQNFVVKIDEQVIFERPISQGQVKVYEGKQISSGTYTIKHDDNGSKTFTAYVEAGLYDWDANSFGEEEFELPQIARASEIEDVADTYFGEPCIVKWTPKSVNFKYKLKFSLYGKAEETDFIVPNTTELYTYTGYTIPTDAVAGIPDDSKAEATVTLFTYFGDTQIGSTDTKSFKVIVPDTPDFKPSVTIKSITASNGTFIHGTFIQGISKAVLEVEATAKKLASISNTTITVDGKDYDEVITSFGNIVVSVTAVDSRGLSTTVTETIYVYPYAPPRIVPADNQVKVICSRWDSEKQVFSDTGELLKFIAKAEFSPVGDTNTVSFWMRWKTSSGEFSNKISLESTDGACEAVSPVTFSKNDSYIVELGVTDTVGESTSMIFTILSEEVYWHRGDKFLSLGMRKDYGGFETAWPATFHDGVYIVENGNRMSLANYILKVINGG